MCVLRVVPQVPEIRDNVLRKHEGKWKKIAKQQMKVFFNPSEAEIREQARRSVGSQIIMFGVGRDRLFELSVPYVIRTALHGRSACMTDC